MFIPNFLTNAFLVLITVLVATDPVFAKTCGGTLLPTRAESLLKTGIVGKKSFLLLPFPIRTLEEARKAFPDLPTAPTILKFENYHFELQFPAVISNRLLPKLLQLGWIEPSHEEGDTYVQIILNFDFQNHTDFLLELLAAGMTMKSPLENELMIAAPVHSLNGTTDSMGRPVSQHEKESAIRSVLNLFDILVRKSPAVEIDTERPRVRFH